MFKIYHNPRCKKSRAGLQFLETNNIDFEIINYIKEPVSVGELTDVFAKLNRKPSEMIRKQEAIFKSDFKGKQFTEEEWIRIFSQHPKLMNRPIVAGKYKAIWADPADNIEDII